MPDHPIVQLLIFAAVVVWSLFQLFAHGEAQNSAVVFMEWFAVFGASLAAIGAVYRLATGKQLGAKERKS
jgi:hypothetical protein